MNLFKKITFEKVLIVYVIISPIIDVLTSLCVRYLKLPLTFGMIIRTAFLILVVIYSFFVMNKRQIISSLIYYLIVFIYLALFIFLSISKYEMSGMLLQLKGCLKVFSFPIVLLGLMTIFKNRKIKISNKCFVFSLLGYCMFIIFPYLVGVDFPTYDIGNKEGTIGLFYAGNEIGAILCILSCYLVIELFNANIKKLWLNIIICIMTIFCTMYMGTKAPFIGNVLLILISIIVAIFITLLKNKKYACRIIGCLGVLILIWISAGYTPVGRNTYIEPFRISFSKSDDVKIAKEKLERKKRKLQDKGDVLSGRESFLIKNLSEYKNGSIKEKLFGIGYVSNDNGNIVTRKLVEMDYYDIFLCHGIIGTIVYIIPILIILLKILIETIKKIREIIVNKDVVIIGYAILISIGIAYMAGHTFTSSAVNILLSLTLVKELYLLKDLKVNKNSNKL